MGTLVPQAFNPVYATGLQGKGAWIKIEKPAGPFQSLYFSGSPLSEAAWGAAISTTPRPVGGDPRL